MLVACEEVDEVEHDLIGGVIANTSEDDVALFLELGTTYVGRIAQAQEEWMRDAVEQEEIAATTMFPRTLFLSEHYGVEGVHPSVLSEPYQAYWEPWSWVLDILEDEPDLTEATYHTMEEDAYHNAYTVFYVVEEDAIYVEVYFDKLLGQEAEDETTLRSAVLHLYLEEDAVVLEARWKTTSEETLLKVHERDGGTLRTMALEAAFEQFLFTRPSTRDMITYTKFEETIHYTTYLVEVDALIDVDISLEDGSKHNEYYEYRANDRTLLSVQILSFDQAATNRYLIRYYLGALDGWDKIVFLEAFDPMGQGPMDAVLYLGEEPVSFGEEERISLWMYNTPVLLVDLERVVLTESDVELGYSNLSFDDISFAELERLREMVDRAYFARILNDWHAEDALDDLVLEYSDDHLEE
jgi:hypothetical protein